MCRLTRHILSPKTICTPAAHFVAMRQIVHRGDTMCRQRSHNLSPATNCAGVTKCAVTNITPSKENSVRSAHMSTEHLNRVLSYLLTLSQGSVRPAHTEPGFC